MAKKSELTTSDAVEVAENTLAAAHQAHRAALARVREHEQLIETVETALSDMGKTVRDSLASPDQAAAWRTRRAELVGEIEGLRLQLEALQAPVKDTEAGIRAAERTLQGARLDDLTRRLAEAEAGLRPHFEAIVRAYRLHCERHKGYFSEVPYHFSDWLIGGDGLFDLREFANDPTT